MGCAGVTARATRQATSGGCGRIDGRADDDSAVTVRSIRDDET
jgi:hypothetical protein